MKKLLDSILGVSPKVRFKRFCIMLTIVCVFLILFLNVGWDKDGFHWRPAADIKINVNKELVK